MSRFYEREETTGCKEKSLTVRIKVPESSYISLEISIELSDALDDLQREHWRLERRESRHTVHLETIPDIYLPHEKHVKTPEQILIERTESEILAAALDQIPPIQKRRFLLRYLFEYPITDIAKIEGCSDRAIKYSISLAKKNLREILSESILIEGL